MKPKKTYASEAGFLLLFLWIGAAGYILVFMEESRIAVVRDIFMNFTTIMLPTVFATLGFKRYSNARELAHVPDTELD